MIKNHGISITLLEKGITRKKGSQARTREKAIDFLRGTFSSLAIPQKRLHALLASWQVGPHFLECVYNSIPFPFTTSITLRLFIWQDLSFLFILDLGPIINRYHVMKGSLSQKRKLVSRKKVDVSKGLLGES